MASQNDVNRTTRGRWPRGREVQIDGGTISCKLGKEMYSLEESYKYAPHLQFMNIDSDEKLRRFVRSWGPLMISDAQRKSGVVSTSVKQYWNVRRCLRSFADLLRAFHDRECERKYLRNYLQAAVERSPNQPLIQTIEMVHLYGLFRADPLASRLAETGTLRWEDWLEQADLRALRKATAYLIENALPVTATIEAVWKSNPPHLRARWSSDCLEDCIQWMVLKDALDDNLFRYCAECHKAFRPVSSHQTKFCGYECGHRVASRESARRRRRM